MPARVRAAAAVNFMLIWMPEYLVVVDDVGIPEFARRHRYRSFGVHLEIRIPVFRQNYRPLELCVYSFCGVHGVGL
jgi:hypothetical protein